LKLIIDINCDLGESYGAFKVGNDEQVMPHITSANIACGFHGGDSTVMAKTVNLAKKHKVAIGAHPGFPDLMGFGRREMQLAPDEVRNYMIYQVGALQAFAKAARINLQHVKPHGALYKMAAKDWKLSKAIAEAVKTLDKNLIIFAQPRSALAKAASKTGLLVAFEFFADRAYNHDGCLVSRAHPESIVQDPRKIVERAVRVVKEQTVSTVGGETIRMSPIHTICVHGDTPAAVELAEALNKGLTKAGIRLASVGSFL